MSSEPAIMKIQIPGLFINARVWGKPTGRPMLAMHGWLDNSATFDLLAPYLPELYLISIDLPGHGFSQHLPLCSTYNFIDLALQMFQVVDALQWPVFSILGHSLGGAIGQFMAAIAPERIQQLVLIDIYGALTIDSTDFLAQIQKHLKSRQRIVDHTIYASLEEAANIRAKLNTTREIPLAAARVLTDAGTKKVANGYEWTFDTRLLLPMAVTPTKEQEQLIIQNVKTDCLMVVGSRGILHDNDWNGWKTSVPKYFKIAELEGGHHLHLENPRSVAAAIRDFLHLPASI